MDKKKLISIGIVVLTIIVVVIVATIGGGNDEQGEITTTQSTTLPETESVIIEGYSAEVLENSLKVYKDDVFVQELTYPTDHKGEFVLGLAKNHIAFLDMNFDGNEDICLTISASQGKYNYYCWIYNTEKDEFEYNKTLSSLTSISLDKEKKQIVSTEEKDGKKVYVIYEWKDGEFKKLETKTKKPAAVKDNVLGSTSSSNTTSRPDKNQSTSNSSNGISGVLVPEVSNSSGSSGGIVIATENKNDKWY